MRRGATRKRAPRRTSANGRGWVRGPSRAAPGAGSAYRRGRYEILADVVRAGSRRRSVWLVWEQVGGHWRVASQHELLKDAKAAATSTARRNSIGVYGQPPLPPSPRPAGFVREGFAWRMNGAGGRPRRNPGWRVLTRAELDRTIHRSDVSASLYPRLADTLASGARWPHRLSWHAVAVGGREITHGYAPAGAPGGELAGVLRAAARALDTSDVALVHIRSGAEPAGLVTRAPARSNRRARASRRRR